jgi:hypothetical protein
MQTAKADGEMEPCRVPWGTAAGKGPHRLEWRFVVCAAPGRVRRTPDERSLLDGGSHRPTLPGRLRSRARTANATASLPSFRMLEQAVAHGGIPSPIPARWRC